MSIFSKSFRRKPQCAHIWEAMPWYLETDESYEYSGYLVDIIHYHRLVATYVCSKCGKVQEKTLSRGCTEFYEDHLKAIHQIETQSESRLQPKFIVEAMVEDERRKVKKENEQYDG